MEAIAGASSIGALVSLSLQLGKDIKKLFGFWQSMRGASEHIEWVARDLLIISGIADSIREGAEAPRAHPRSLDISLKALEQCRDSAAESQGLIYKHQPGLQSPSPTEPVRRLRLPLPLKSLGKVKKLRG